MYHRLRAKAELVWSLSMSWTVSGRYALLQCMSIPRGFFLNTTVKNGGCGGFLSSIFCSSIFMPYECTKRFPIDWSICGFHFFVVSVYLFLYIHVARFTFAWFSKKKCLFFFFYIWSDINYCFYYSRQVVVIVDYIWKVWCFIFSSQCYSEKGAYTYR